MGCYDYEDDGSTCLGIVQRKARKPHRCDDCSRVIQPGEEYTHGRWVGGDAPMTFKGCSDCRRLREIVRLRNLQGGGCESEYGASMPYGDGIMAEDWFERDRDEVLAIFAEAGVAPWPSVLARKPRTAVRP